ncbi:MAG: tRNA (N6-threonylcarbamoyladenosine(37)-N6)-methyltransferase TrmO [Desulfobacteraceae bacterium]|nr:MAG: tRNA (N6-threonylcarbamoyladenosine(37)-N6)-methyltransferase TrmO [Desulfobacteraceae bacterium]
MKELYEAFPVGMIRKEDKATFLVLYEKYSDGLLGIEQFSHLILFCWFKESDTRESRSTLRVHPRADKRNPLTGVFATRSPKRPNPIALFVSRIRGIDHNRVEIDPIDAFDGTPVIDIKPYIPISDSIQDAVVPGWVGVGKERTHAKTQSR